MSTLTSLLTVAEPISEPAYDRSRFIEKIDEDGDGCNTRQEVLIRDSTQDVTITPPCAVSEGRWVSVYDGIVTEDPSKIEMDHVVALAEAWRSGAWAWTDVERMRFANDLEVDYALQLASSQSNQSKADRDPARWVPSDPARVCDYVTDWTLIKIRWQLSVDPTELSAIEGVLTGECGTREVALPEVQQVTKPIEEEPGIPPTQEPEPEPEPQTIIEGFGVGETRLAGQDRYLTSIEVSKRYAPGVPSVFVATGRDFPDALSASAAAAHLGAPLLLTEPTSVPATVLKEIKRLQPANIFVVGGTGVVSSGVVKTLGSIAPVQRLSGTDRYATGLDIAKHSFTSSSLAVIATGRSFPDALSATSVAGINGGPVILVDGLKKTVPQSVLTELSRLGVKSVVIAGGTGVVTSNIQTQLSNAGYSVQRLGGADRYETASLINDRFFPSGSSSTYFLATGQNFPDALSGAALAGRIGAPLFVSQTSCMPHNIATSIKNLGASSKVVLGSTGAVSTATASLTVCKPPAKPVVHKPATPKPSTPKPETPKRVYVPNHVTPGAFCKKADTNKYGYSSRGVLMKCTLYSGEKTPRWRAA